jgi:hypothetical protein
MGRDQQKVLHTAKGAVVKVQISRWAMRWDQLVSYTARWAVENSQNAKWARGKR